MRKIFVFISVLIAFFLVVQTVQAHPGRTDVRGGHICKTNCKKWGYVFGEWHSHSKDNPVKNGKQVSKTVAKKTTKIKGKK